MRLASFTAGPTTGKASRFAASDVAIEDFADVQTEIHVGYRFAVRRPAPVQFNNALARSDRRGQCRSASARAVFRSEDRKRTVADQLNYVTAMPVNCGHDCIEVVIQ